MPATGGKTQTHPHTQRPNIATAPDRDKPLPDATRPVLNPFDR